MEDIFKGPNGIERGGKSLIFELKNKLGGINSRIDIVIKYQGTGRHGNRNYSRGSREKTDRKIQKISVTCMIISFSTNCM